MEAKIVTSLYGQIVRTHAQGLGFRVAIIVPVKQQKQKPSLSSLCSHPSPKFPFSCVNWGVTTIVPFQVWHLIVK